MDAQMNKITFPGCRRSPRLENESMAERKFRIHVGMSRTVFIIMSLTNLSYAILRLSGNDSYSDMQSHKSVPGLSLFVSP